MEPRRPRRMDWAGPAVRGARVGGDVEDLGDVEYLFWVGCAGAYDDRAKRTTRAVAELLHEAACRSRCSATGRPAPATRRGGPATSSCSGCWRSRTSSAQGGRASKVVATCAHCFNTLKNEYSQLGVELEVVHHTQLLDRLVRDGRLPPVAAPTAGSSAARSPTTTRASSAGTTRSTSPPRELLVALPGAPLTEMPRNRERSFCAGRAAPACDGGVARRADQREPHQRGRRAPELTRSPRLPVLQGHALRWPRPRMPADGGPATKSRCSTSPSCCSPPYAVRATDRLSGQPHAFPVGAWCYTVKV